MPDGGWRAPDVPLTLSVPTAVAVLEVLSPGDEMYARLGLYAARGVQEVFVADPEARTMTCHVRSAPAAGTGARKWVEAEASRVFGCTTAWLSAQVRWSAPGR